MNFIKAHASKIAVGATAVSGLAMATLSHAADLFTAPSAASFIDDAAAWVSPLVTSLLVAAAIIAGVLLAGMFTSRILGVVVQGAKKVTGGGRRH